MNTPPPLLPPEDMPPVVDQPSLEHTWRALMGELGFSRPQVYALFLDESRVLMLNHVDGVPGQPAPPDVQRAIELYRQVLAHEPGLSMAFLYCRPGSSVLTPADLTWARGLWSICGPQGWPVHVASDDDIRLITPDDLQESRAAS